MPCLRNHVIEINIRNFFINSNQPTLQGNWLVPTSLLSNVGTTIQAFQPLQYLIRDLLFQRPRQCNHNVSSRKLHFKFLHLLAITTSFRETTEEAISQTTLTSSHPIFESNRHISLNGSYQFTKLHRLERSPNPNGFLHFANLIRGIANSWKILRKKFKLWNWVLRKSATHQVGMAKMARMIRTSRE